MAKNKKKHKHHFRNAAPRPPRAARPAEETNTHRLGYTVAGAAGSALLGAFLAREGWAPKTVSGALCAVGAGLAWKGDSTTIRSVGAGAMSGAGAQLTLLLMDDHEAKANPQEKSQAPNGVASKGTATKPMKPANAGELPGDALEAAYYRARERLAASASEQEAA
jgi:hypothetical protein